MDTRSAAPASAPSSEPTRRNLLFMATGAMTVTAAGATMVPLIDQMNPDASTIAAGGPIDLDLGEVEPGSQVIVRWRSRPVFVVFRTAEVLKTLQDPRLLGELADPHSEQLQQPPYARNWHRSLTPEIAVLVGVCTHLGCIPQFDPRRGDLEPTADWFGGYFCACHGSKYDLAGRVFRNVPAPFNLPVPPYHFVSDTKIRIGENPPNDHFDFSSILQI